MKSFLNFSSGAIIGSANKKLLSILFTYNVSEHCHSTQPAFSCLKLTTETLEQGVKYVQRYQ